LNLGMAGNRKLSKSIPKLFLNLFSNGVYQSIPSNLIAMCYHKGARQFLQIDVNRPYTCLTGTSPRVGACITSLGLTWCSPKQHCCKHSSNLK
jgi:hypothetical protein